MSSAFLILVWLFSALTFAGVPKYGAVSTTENASGAPAVKTPVDGETCFSPDEPCDVKLSKFIQSAKKSIDVAIYDINLDTVVHALLVASKKIRVRILVDRRQAKGQRSLVPLILKAGGNVRYGRQRGIQHNKFTDVDGKMVQTGSFNYTNGAAFKNSENQIYIATPGVVKRYRILFDKLWGDGKPLQGPALKRKSSKVRHEAALRSIGLTKLGGGRLSVSLFE